MRNSASNSTVRPSSPFATTATVLGVVPSLSFVTPEMANTSVPSRPRLSANQAAVGSSPGAAALPRSEIVRQVIAHSMLSAHRYVFGVFAWYSLLSAFGLGPAGAVMYRLAEYFSVVVQRTPTSTSLLLSSALRRTVAQAWSLIDWIPARITALGFAFVGSFEEAIDRWRKYELVRPGDNDGIVLAATAGALNVQLAPDDLQGGAPIAQTAHLRAVVGLVWRTVVMWMVILALLSLARLLG